MKKILMITGGLLAASFIFGFKKVAEIKEIIFQLQTRFEGIHNIQLDVLNNHVSFLADLVVSNPTNLYLDLNTQTLITLSKVFFYDANNNLIAFANLNLTQINIAPLSSLKIADVPIEMTISQGFNQIQNILSNIEGNNMNIILEFKAFNQTFTTQLNNSLI